MAEFTQRLSPLTGAENSRSPWESPSLHLVKPSHPEVTHRFQRRAYLPTYSGQVWLLKSGVVRTLTHTEEGAVIVLGVWGPGDIVGLPLSLANPYLIESMTEVQAVTLSTIAWQPPAEAFVSYLKQTEQLMIARAPRRADLALFGVLNWLAQRFGLQVERGCLIDLRITHQDLADLSGISRVTVTRLLRQLEEKGLLYRRSRQLILAESTHQWHYQI